LFQAQQFWHVVFLLVSGLGFGERCRPRLRGVSSRVVGLRGVGHRGALCEKRGPHPV
jgi:hypothetical protein